MSELVISLPSTDWARVALVYTHLLACVSAIALVAQADWRLVTGVFTIDGLHHAARRTAFALLVLWITGLALVYRDIGLDAELLLADAKLLLKFAVVTVLTLNGALLHALSFPILARRRTPSLLQSLGLAVTGALSTSHWLLAAFVGVSRPLAQWPLDALLVAYTAYAAVALGAAFLCAPWLRSQLRRRSRGQRRRAPVHTPVHTPVRSVRALDRERSAAVVRETYFPTRPDARSLPRHFARPPCPASRADRY